MNCSRSTFNDSGEITSIFDKEAVREWLPGRVTASRCTRMCRGWDAWDIDSMYVDAPVELPEKATIEVVAEGPLVAVLRIARKLHNSTMTQEISLRRGSRRVDFATSVDWQESHKMLKVAFPVSIHANEAIHEIQFGHIRRPNHRPGPSTPIASRCATTSGRRWPRKTEAVRCSTTASTV